MYEAMMIAASGLKNQQYRLDTIANNVANVNSSAYKSVRLDFKDALYTAGIVPAKPRSPDGNQQKGHGVMVAGVSKDFSVGNMQRTDRPLDAAIEGEGFFELGDRDGSIVYTRNGVFSLSVEEGGDFLVNGDGLYLLDAGGNRISVPYGTDTISINTDGTISFSAFEEETTVKIGVYTFRNITGLLSVGDGDYAESAASGEKLPADGATVRSGMIEGSNVNLAEEMTRLIRTQRTFQLSSRALTTADEMEGIANNMRR
ncbi:MAG: flagellar hook-basal body protein [Oscillospiraceae bacterium]|nr:flagellar hook-basal body protein [Oscillospiraceae bacterium]